MPGDAFSHTRIPALRDIWLRFHLTFFTLHFAATLAEKRIKSENEGCKVPQLFTAAITLGRKFRAQLFEVERTSVELRLAIARPVNLSERNALSTSLSFSAETVVSIYVRKKSISSLFRFEDSMSRSDSLN